MKAVRSRYQRANVLIDLYGIKTPVLVRENERIGRESGHFAFHAMRAEISTGGRQRDRARFLRVSPSRPDLAHFTVNADAKDHGARTRVQYQRTSTPHRGTTLSVRWHANTYAKSLHGEGKTPRTWQVRPCVFVRYCRDSAGRGTGNGGW